MQQQSQRDSEALLPMQNAPPHCNGGAFKEDAQQKSADSKSAAGLTLEYRCPGQQHPISRAVHLGRLAAFYPPCRQCPHRDDTGTLSPRQVEQLQEVRASHRTCSLFHDEGAGGVYLNDLTPAAARNMAAAFGLAMQREASGGNSPLLPSPQSLIPNPSVLLAGDGRALTAELSAAASEGLRSSGCNVVDIGPATAACLAFAVDHLSAAGGMLVGNPSEKPHGVGLQFWAAGPRPLSTGGSLEPVVQLYQGGVDRPGTSFRRLHRAAADEPYLAALSECYHALRPLRILIASASGPLVAYLQKLAATVACQVIPCRVAPGNCRSKSGPMPATSPSVSTAMARSAACSTSDGQAVPAERLLLLLAGITDTLPIAGRPRSCWKHRLRRRSGGGSSSSAAAR